MDSNASKLLLKILTVFSCMLLAACAVSEDSDARKTTGASETNTPPEYFTSTPQTETIPKETVTPISTEPVYVRVETREEMEKWADEADVLGLYNHNVALVISGNIGFIPWYCIEECQAVRIVVLEEGNTIMEDNTRGSVIKGLFDKVILPSTIETLSPTYVLGGIREIELNPMNSYFKMVDGILYDNNMEIVYYANKYITEAHLPDTVREIGVGAFSDCALLKFVSIPISLEDISSFAFDSCISLTEIRLPRSLQYLGGGTFADTSALKRLYIPANINFIPPDDWGGSLFSGECGLQSIVCEGNNLILDESVLDFGFPPEQIVQLVFLSSQPTVVNDRVLRKGFTNATVYYLTTNIKHWAPNGETTWHGMPMVAIESLDDLPPLD